MKKTALILIAALSITSVFVISKDASAGYGIGRCTDASDGNPNDTTWFPYRFICGGHKSDPTNAQLFINNDETFPRDITANTTVSVRGTYNVDQATNREVLVWFTIDGPQQLTVGGTGNNRLINTSGQTSLACPGTSGTANHPGAVWNYRDTGGSYPDGTGSNGTEASPAAYNYENTPGLGNLGDDTGKENCGDDGRMVYWTDASNTQGRHSYNFDYELKPGRTTPPNQQLCFRMNISIRLGPPRNNPGDWPYFPAPSTSTTPYQQSVVASRIAKQSDRKCFNITNQTPQAPQGGLKLLCGVNSPSRFKVNGYDPDHPGAWPAYRIVRVSTGATIESGSTHQNDNGTYQLSGGRSFVVGEDYKLQVQDTEWVGIQLSSPSETDYKDVGSPFEAPNCAGNADCSQINFTLPNTARLYRVWVNDNGSTGAPTFGEMNQANPPAPDFTDTASGVVTLDLLAANKVVSGDLQFTLAEVRRIDIGGGVMANRWVYYDTSYPKTVTNCNRATCEIVNITGPALLNKQTNHYNVIANTAATVEMKLTNTGRNSIGPTLGIPQPPPRNLSANMTGVATNITGLASQGFGELNAGESSPVITFGITTPDDISNGHTINYYPDFSNWGRIGPDCGTALHTYKYFDHGLTPTLAITQGDLENPQEIRYGGSISETLTGYPVTGTATYQLTKNGGTFDGVHTRGDDYGNITLDGHIWADGDITTPEFVAGDKICSYISLTNKTGYRGAGGVLDVINGAAGNSGEFGCQIVYDLPFVRSYQGDVVSGGRFGANGLVGDGTIAGNIRSSHAGSGSEFGVITGGIFFGGFASAMLRDLSGTELPLPPSGLTFANSPGATRGQYYANSQRQVVDYFKDTKKADTPVTPPTPNLTISPTPNGQTWFQGNMTLNGDQVIPTGARHTVYVEGNVTINGNIDYGTFTSPESIPYFSLIVKGNIYITKNVQRLDGRYIAQPTGVNNTDVNTGIIYTCTDTNGSRFVPADLYDNCNDNRLTVNGSLMAQKIKFLRTNGTLRDIPINISGGATSLRYAVYVKANGPTPRTFAGRVNFPTAPASTTVTYTPTPTGPTPQITSGCADLGSISNFGVTSYFELCYWNASGGTISGNPQPQIVLDTDPTPVGKTCRTVNLLVTPNKKLCVASNAWGSTTGYEQLKYGSDKIAEQIRLTPEFLIGDPAYKPKPKGEPINGQYDSIVTLPPIL